MIPSKPKPTKFAVSLVIRDTTGRYLVVKRPDDPKDDIGGVWGFPAASSDGTETEWETAHRVARDKLGVRVELGRRIGESTHERPTILLHLVDYEARVVEGSPSVPQADHTVTQYEALFYTDDPLTVLAAAKRGSQCTQLFLEDLGINWREVV